MDVLRRTLRGLLIKVCIGQKGGAGHPFESRWVVAQLIDWAYPSGQMARA